MVGAIQYARKSTGGKAPRRQLWPDFDTVFNEESGLVGFDLPRDEMRCYELSYMIRMSDPTWTWAHGEAEFRNRWVETASTIAILGTKLDYTSIIKVLDELKSHAAILEDHDGLQPTACYNVYQSDGFLPENKQNSVLEGIRQLDIDSEGVLVRIVDPDMYCFVSGRSKMKNLIYPPPFHWLNGSRNQRPDGQQYMWIVTPFSINSSGLAKAMSPINNVHPDCTEAYHAIEQVLSASAGMFDQVLGRLSSLKNSTKDGGRIGVVVEVFRIRLDGGHPNMNATEWSVVGGKEDDVAASVLYCAQSENIVGGDVCFRAPLDEDLYPVSSFSPDCEASLNELKELYGVGMQSHQSLGSVPVVKGRFIGWPNQYQYQLSPTRLDDPTKAGCRTYILLHLISPRRYTNNKPDTERVTHQQIGWYTGALRQCSNSGASRIPPEVAEMIALETGDCMSQHTALQYCDAAKAEKRRMNEELNAKAFEASTVCHVENCSQHTTCSDLQDSEGDSEDDSDVDI